MSESASIFHLQDNHECVILESPAGLYNGIQLAAIAKVCEDLGLVSKATEDQRICLYISPSDRPAIESALNPTGLSLASYKSGVRTVKSCLGSACPLSSQDALAAALDLTALLNDLPQNRHLSIAINGCQQGCVPGYTSDISITGASSGFQIALGGKSTQYPELASFLAEGIPAQDLPSLVKKLVQSFLTNALEEESFGTCIERLGLDFFAKQISPFAQDIGNEDPFADLENSELSESDFIAETEDKSRTQAESTETIPAADEDLDALADAFSEALPLVEEGTQDQIAIEDKIQTGNDFSLNDEIPIAQNASEELSFEGDISLAEGLTELEEEVSLDQISEDSPKSPEDPFKDHGPEDELGDPINQETLDHIPEDDISEEGELSLQATNQDISNSPLDIQVEKTQEDVELAIEASIDELTVEEITDEDENLEDRGSALEALEEGRPETDQTDLESLDEFHAGLDSHSESEIGQAQVAGVKISNGQLCFDFGSGAQVSVNLEKNLRRQGDKRSFTFENQNITVELTETGIKAEVDGLEFFVPKKAA